MKLILELEDWRQRASTEIEQSLSGNRQKINILECSRKLSTMLMGT